MATFVVCQIYIFPSNKHEIMKKMTKNENNDSFMREKINLVRAVDGMTVNERVTMPGLVSVGCQMNEISAIMPGTVTLSFTVHRPHYIFVLHERVIDRSITVPRSNTGNDLSAACCQKAMDRLQAR